MADEISPISIQIADGFDMVDDARVLQRRFLIGRWVCVALAIGCVLAALAQTFALLFLVLLAVYALDVEWGLRNLRTLSSAPTEGASEIVIDDATLTIRHPSLAAEIVIAFANIRTAGFHGAWGTGGRFAIERLGERTYPVGTPTFLFTGDGRWAETAPILSVGYRTGTPTVVLVFSAPHRVHGLFDRYIWLGGSQRFSWLTDRFRRDLELLAPVGVAFRTQQPELVASLLSDRGVRVGLDYDDWAHIAAHKRLRPIEA